jgi:hypothetical protein
VQFKISFEGAARAQASASGRRFRSRFGTIKSRVLFFRPKVLGSRSISGGYRSVISARCESSRTSTDEGAHTQVEVRRRSSACPANHLIGAGQVADIGPISRSVPRAARRHGRCTSISRPGPGRASGWAEHTSIVVDLRTDLIPTVTASTSWATNGAEHLQQAVAYRLDQPGPGPTRRKITVSQAAGIMPAHGSRFRFEVLKSVSARSRSNTALPDHALGRAARLNASHAFWFA